MDDPSFLQVDEELLKRIESVLFSAGKKLLLNDIAALCGHRGNVALVEAGVKRLKEMYDAQGSSLMVVQDGECWKLTVRERYLPFVRRIVTQTELSKSVMETLAVIAYKAPLLQSNLIKIRTNKAYDHVDQLEEEGYILRKKKGRTKEIFLAPKFFEYFDLPPDALKDRFTSVKQVDEAVMAAETRLKNRKEDLMRKKEEAREKETAVKAEASEHVRRLDEAIKAHPVIELVDEKGRAHELQTFDEPVILSEPPPPPLEVIENKLGDLEVVTTEPQVEIIESDAKAASDAEKVSEPVEEPPTESPESAEVNRRVAELLGGFASPEEPAPEEEPNNDKELPQKSRKNTV